MAGSFTLLTWNTCGIKNTEKKTKILQTLIKQQASVAFLQETHIGVHNHSHIKNICSWKTFYSVHHPRSKGVAILIKDEVPFEYIKQDVDPTGSYIVLICKLYGKCFTLVNVYNHAKEHKVLQCLSEYLCQTAKGVLIVAGDFNTVLNTDLDREFPTGHTEPLRPYLEEFISSLMLVDIWGLKNPFNRDSYTRFPWKSSKKRGASRLDMILMPRNALWLVKSCKIKRKKISISDHCPVILHLDSQESDQAACFTGKNVANHTKAAEICEAEVLKAISSLIECKTTTGESLEDIRINKEHKAVELKLRFNTMITNESIPTDFTETEEVNGWHFFKAEYMILATILVRRIETFLQPSFKTKNIKTSFQNIGVVGFQTTPKTIDNTFLNEAIKSLKRIHPSPPRGFGILKKLLPRTSRNIQLREGCPLTPTLLTLTLKYLASVLQKDSDESVVDVCHHRKCLTIYMNYELSTLEQKMKQFQTVFDSSLLCSVHKQKKDETESLIQNF